MRTLDEIRDQYLEHFSEGFREGWADYLAGRPHYLESIVGHDDLYTRPFQSGYKAGAREVARVDEELS